MPPLTIWGRHNSNNVKKALWAAHELGLPFDSKIVGMQYGGTRTDEYLSMNPMAQIPTLVDGDFVLCESNAIVRYLFAEYASGSGPDSPSASRSSAFAAAQATPRARAIGDRWMDWTTSSFASVFRGVFWPMVRQSAAERDEAALAKAITEANELLAVPEAWLAKNEWLSGDAFGAGDIPLGCFIYAWFEMDIPRAEMPNLEKWYGRLKEREAFRKAVMTPLT